MQPSVLLYSGDTLIFGHDIVSDITLTIPDGDYLLVRDGGAASHVTVSQNCMLELEDGATADGISLLSEGACLVKAGARACDISIENGGICNLHGEMEIADVSGTLYLFDNASLGTALVESDGLLSLWGNACHADGVIAYGTLSVHHGAISDSYAVSGGRIRLSQGAKADTITIYGGSSIEASTSATICHLLALENSFVSIAEGVILNGTVCLFSPITISGKIDAYNADFVLVPNDSVAENTPMIPDWSLCTPRSLAVSVSEDIEPRAYLLSDNFSTPATITIVDDCGHEIGQCSTSNRISHGDCIFSLELNDGTLAFRADYCTFTRLTPELTLRTDGGDIAVFGREAINATSWQKDSEPFENEHITTIEPETAMFDASAIESPAVFFAEAAGGWGRTYVASNVNTGETLSMNGMNRFNGVFKGSDRPSLLMLTNDDDAIFADDIFTPFPENAAKQSRIAQLSEIRAGAGDDIIDMTCEHFHDANARITLRGGDGDDTIWGANDGSLIFGDAGDDNLTGGFGDDLLCGGSGDDILRGLGGHDIYAFGHDAGNDTVVIDGGDFILWFDEGIVISEDDIAIDGSTVVISFGAASSVTVSNLPDSQIADRIVCGDCGKHFGATYASLEDHSVFDSDSSTRHFTAIA